MVNKTQKEFEQVNIASKGKGSCTPPEKRTRIDQK